MQNRPAAMRAAPGASRAGSIAARLALALWLVLASAASAHEIPAGIKLSVLVKPSADRLELLVRVPMQAMREVDLPLRGPGYLIVSQVDAALRTAARMWLLDSLDLYENGARLEGGQVVAARVSLPSDTSWGSWEEARRHLDGPRLADELDLVWHQQLLDVLIAYPITSETASLAIRARVDRLALNVTTALVYLSPAGAARAYELHGDAGLVRLDPRWHHAAARFLVSGIWHIQEGADHLLFLLCLVIPFRRWRPLVAIVTAFTVAHSITLIASAMGLGPDGLWFPALIETLIAATVLWMAVENIVGARLQRRWVAAFALGLVHGFAFSFALRESFQFAGDHLLVALLAFNAGVELGQLLAVAVMVPALVLLFRHVVEERVGTIILSVLAGHAAWHWMVERGAVLAKVPLPKLDAAFAVGAMQLAMAGMALALVVLLASGWLNRWARAG